MIWSFGDHNGNITRNREKNIIFPFETCLMFTMSSVYAFPFIFRKKERIITILTLCTKESIWTEASVWLITGTTIEANGVTQS